MVLFPPSFGLICNQSFINCNRRPTALQDRTRDSDDDDYQDRDYDVAALANNLSQAFRYGIYSNDDMDEVLFNLISPSLLSIFGTLTYIYIYISLPQMRVRNKGKHTKHTSLQLKQLHTNCSFTLINV